MDLFNHSPLAAELNPARFLMILLGGLLAAELNPARDLMILLGGLLAAELNPAPDLIILHGRLSCGSGAKPNS